MSARDELHEVIDGLDDASVENLLARVRSELTGDMPSLSPAALASIIRGLTEASQGKGIPHVEAMNLAGLT